MVCVCVCVCVLWCVCVVCVVVCVVCVVCVSVCVCAVLQLITGYEHSSSYVWSNQALSLKLDLIVVSLLALGSSYL